MKIEFTGRQIDITPDLRKLAERRLQKVGKLLPKLTSAHVVLTADKRRKLAEVSVHSSLADLAAVGVSDDARMSVTEAFDKLLRQVERARTRLRVRKGAASPRKSAPAPAEAAPEPAGPRIVRTRRAAIKPMTLDEAALEIGGRGDGDGVLVFRDATTERVTVLFRRKDGNLGLIEPEA